MGLTRHTLLTYRGIEGMDSCVWLPKKKVAQLFLHLSAPLPDAEEQPTNFALLALGFPT